MANTTTIPTMEEFMAVFPQAVVIRHIPADDECGWRLRFELGRKVFVLRALPEKNEIDCWVPRIDLLASSGHWEKCVRDAVDGYKNYIGLRMDEVKAEMATLVAQLAVLDESLSARN